MLFDSPMPWLEVVKLIEGKQLMPTAAGSAELSTFDKDLRKYSVFSARTPEADYLAEVQKVLKEYSDGTMNMADAKMTLQAWLRDRGYTPEGGFPGHEGEVPPANSLLQNLASDVRIKLLVETGSRLAQSTAYLQGGMAPAARFDYPCWEFVRLYYRKHPRGESGKENDPDWQDRWVRSGGTLYQGRMIATKDDAVWEAISDSGVWPDGLDSDADPVVFNTGYGRVEVPRADCVDLGVIDADDAVAAENVRLVGQMFDDPDRATLADYAAKKTKLIAALAALKEAA